MTIMKRIVMGFGVLFLCGAALLGYVAWDSRAAEESGNTFIQAFLTDFSRSWAVADVASRFTPDNIEQLASESGKTTLREFSKLGRLKAIEGLTLVNHMVTPQAKVSTFDLIAKFEGGEVVTRVVLLSEDGAMKVKDMALKTQGPVRAITQS